MPTFRHINERREMRTSEVSRRLRSETATSYFMAGWLRCADFEAAAAASSPAILPKTRPSRREFEPRRFAPWRPVDATSPHA